MTQSKSSQALASESIPRLILRYSATTLASLVLYNVYTLTDTFFVSRGVGSDAVGGISVVFPLIVILSAVSTALGGGAASLISRKIGQNDFKGGGCVALNAMLAFWLTAIVVTVTGIAFMRPMLTALGATPELYEHSKQYLTIILLGCVFSTGFSSIIRAEGKMKYALMIWIVPISINIILDAVFIFAFKWGVAGSAAATVACQFVSFCMSLVFFRRFSSLDFGGAKPNIKTVGEILAVGVPSLVQQVSLAAVLVIMNNILKRLGGSVAISVFAYVSKIITFAFMPFTAVMQAVSPIIGYNYGAGDYKRTQNAVLTANLLAFIYGAAALAMLPELLLTAFGCKEQVLTQGALAIRITAGALPLLPAAMIMGTAYQSVGKKKNALIMFAVIIVFMLPCAAVLVKLFGVDGIWWSFPAASAFSLAAALTAYKKFPVCV